VTPLPKILGVGETLPVTVTFRPAQLDTDSTRLLQALLVITTEDTCGNATVNVDLFGRGFNTRPIPVRLCFAPAQHATVGSVVDIPIQIDTTVPIIGTLDDTITVSYDPSVLRILGARSMFGTTRMFADPVTHSLKIYMSNLTGSVPSGEFAVLKCEVLIGPRSSATMSIDSVNYSNVSVQNVQCLQSLLFTADSACAGRMGTSLGANVLEQSRPNPITSAFGEATIEYETVADTRVTLRIWDMYGRAIATPVDADLTHGRYTATFDTRGLPNGTYYYSVDAGIFHSARRMVILR
jgi:hypothetical protein